MKNLIGSVVVMSLLLVGCTGGDGTSPTSSDNALLAPTTQPVSQPTSQPTSDPSPGPSASPSPSPSPSPTVVSYVDGTYAQGNVICLVLAGWNEATTNIEIQYTGYYYTLSQSVVTVTFTAGVDQGQTQTVNDPTTLPFGGDFAQPDCTVSVNNGQIVSIVQ